MNWHVVPASEFKDLPSIQRRAMKRHVPCSGYDADHLDLRRGTSEQNGHSVVLAWVGVDNNFLGQS